VPPRAQHGNESNFAGFLSPVAFTHQTTASLTQLGDVVPQLHPIIVLALLHEPTGAWGSDAILWRNIMHRRAFLGGVVAVAAVSVCEVSFAKKAAFSWDGTWSGTIGGGKSVSVTIAGTKVQSYSFNGSSVTINSSSVTAGSVVFTVGSLNGKVTLTPAAGGKANYHYSDPNGGKAVCVLAKSG